MFGPKRQQISGWLAVGVSTTIACFWVMWGIIENFHEGWFYDSLAHELHHIGYGSTCPSKQVSDEIAKLPPDKQTVI